MKNILWLARGWIAGVAVIVATQSPLPFAERQNPEQVPREETRLPRSSLQLPERQPEVREKYGIVVRERGATLEILVEKDDGGSERMRCVLSEDTQYMGEDSSILPMRPKLLKKMVKVSFLGQDVIRLALQSNCSEGRCPVSNCKQECGAESCICQH